VSETSGAQTRVLSRADAEHLLAGSEVHGRLGLELAEWSAEQVGFRFAPPAWTRDPATGAIHGGVLATALDTAACMAAIAAAGVDCSTLDLRCDFLRPALDELFVVTGTPLKAGRRIAWADAAIATAEGRVVAAGRGTFVW
jgi:uncharacterized protein (TIGR00369 family)